LKLQDFDDETAERNPGSPHKLKPIENTGNAKANLEIENPMRLSQELQIVQY